MDITISTDTEATGGAVKSVEEVNQTWRRVQVTHLFLFYFFFLGRMEKKMETKKIWITFCIIALLASGTAVAIVAYSVNHYEKLSMATDIETESSSSEPIIVANESIEKSEEIPGISQNQEESVLGNLSKEEIEKAQAEHEAEFNEWLEIAKKDERVQELIAGKEYEVVSTGEVFIQEGRMAILTLKVEEKYYEITINMGSETVESVEEQSSGRTEFLYRREGAEEKIEK